MCAKPEEQAVSMIPGAVTSEVFLADTDRFRGQRIIAYCTISYRSGKLAAKLKRKGITMVNLKGGLLGWGSRRGAFGARQPSGNGSARLRDANGIWPPPASKTVY